MQGDRDQQKQTQESFQVHSNGAACYYYTKPWLQIKVFLFLAENYFKTVQHVLPSSLVWRH
jgi:hypothetical protein